MAAEEEDASNIILGPDFQDAVCLMTSEVAVLLERRVELNRQSGNDTRPPEAFNKTLAYTQRIRPYKQVAAVKDVRISLNKVGLEQFELAQLGNLVPETVDEAITLIPTLTRMDEDDLKEILEDLSSLRSVA